MSLTKKQSKYVFTERYMTLMDAVKYCKSKGMKFGDVKDKQTLDELYDVARAYAMKLYGVPIGARVQTGFFKYDTSVGIWRDYTEYNATIHRDLFYENPLRNMVKMGEHYLNSLFYGSGVFNAGLPKENCKIEIMHPLFSTLFFCLNETTTDDNNPNTVTSGVLLTSATEDHSYHSSQTNILSFFLSGNTAAVLWYCMLLYVLFAPLSSKLKKFISKRQ